MIDAVLLFVAAVLALNGMLMLLWPAKHLRLLGRVQGALDRSSVHPEEELPGQHIEKRLAGLGFIVIAAVIVRAVVR